MFCPTNSLAFSKDMTAPYEIRRSHRTKAWILILENNLLYFPIMELRVSLWRIVQHHRNPLQKASFVQKSSNPGTDR